jgi:hypothetical protein
MEEINPLEYSNVVWDTNTNQPLVCNLTDITEVIHSHPGANDHSNDKHSLQTRNNVRKTQVYMYIYHTYFSDTSYFKRECGITVRIFHELCSRNPAFHR